MQSIVDIPWEQIEGSFEPWNANQLDCSDIIYSIFLDRFAHDFCFKKVTLQDVFFNEVVVNHRVGGTLKGLNENLLYLKNLGVTTILINPFLQNQQNSYHGYAIIDFLKVDEQLGSTQDLVEMVKNAHRLNLKVIFDCVLNHAGDVFTYYAENSVFDNSIYYSVKNWNNENTLLPIEFKNINLFERKGRIENWEQFSEAIHGDIFELKTFIQNPSNPSGSCVLNLMVDVYLYWAIICNVDGYRIDALKHLNTDFINLFVNRVDEKLKKLGKRNFNFIGEYIYSDRSIIENKFKFDLLNFGFYFFVNGFNRNEKIVLSADKINFIFLENHDQIGFYPKKRFNCGKTNKEIYMWWRFLSLMPHSVPMFYYGSEQGLNGIGELDASIREPLFERNDNISLLNENTIGYTTLKKIIEERALFVSGFTKQTYTLEAIGYFLVLRDSEEAIVLIYNTSQEMRPLSGVFSEKNLSIHKKNVYLFLEESYKEFLDMEVMTSMFPLSILLLTNHYE